MLFLTFDLLTSLTFLVLISHSFFLCAKSYYVNFTVHIKISTEEWLIFWQKIICVVKPYSDWFLVETQLLRSFFDWQILYHPYLKLMASKSKANMLNCYLTLVTSKVKNFLKTKFCLDQYAHLILFHTYILIAEKK